MRLKDKVALVTGAAQGFGQGIAETFAREGAKVAVVDLDLDKAKAVARSIGRRAFAIRADVSKAKDVDRAVAATIRRFGDLSVIVNNAGVSHRNKPMLDVSEDEFDRVFAVNVKSIYLMARAAVPHLRARGGGVICNIGSTAGLRPRPGLTWYNASKGAVNLVSKSMAVELAPDRIRVVAIAPWRERRRCSPPSWARTRPRSAPPSAPPSRSAGSRPRRTSPTPACSSAPTRRRW